MLSAVEPGEYLEEKLAQKEVFALDTGQEVFMPGDGSQAAQSQEKAQAWARKFA